MGKKIITQSTGLEGAAFEEVLSKSRGAIAPSGITSEDYSSLSDAAQREYNTAVYDQEIERKKKYQLSLTEADKSNQKFEEDHPILSTMIVAIIMIYINSYLYVGHSYILQYISYEDGIQQIKFDELEEIGKVSE